MPKKERVKRTRAKAKNVIQKVVVNVGGRGGGGRKSTAPSGPPRPTPLQQATQFIQATQSRPPVLGESMIQSSQMLQRLLDPINMRLEVLMRQRQEVQPQPININNPPINMPPININNPPINIRQPDIFVGPPNVSINQRFPDINIRVPEPFRRGFAEAEPSQQNRQHVADLPDEPLVRPNAPLVLAGPMRMDDPHEDVPLNQVDPIFLGKQEAKEVPVEVAMKEIEEQQEREPVSASKPAQASDRFRSIPLIFKDLDKLPFRRKANTPPASITLVELASYYSLPLPKTTIEGGKASVINYLIQKKGK